jgi:hypothetical protein
MWRSLCILIGWLGLAVCACAQSCPHPSSTGQSVPAEAQTLTGKLVYHDGLRQWYELKLDKAQCGQKSIELILSTNDRSSLQVLRGCQVKSRGALAQGDTGYYSLDLFQGVESVEAVGVCTKQKPLPDYSGFMPDKAIQRYRVVMLVNYGLADQQVIFEVTSAGRKLRPWQAYASQLLTGGYMLYGSCGEGFSVDRVFGTPAATPQHLYGKGEPADMATFDPERAGAAGQKHLRLGYTCVREPVTP